MHPWPVTVRAKDASKAYGQKDPSLFYEAKGVLKNEHLFGTPTREVGQDAGSYAITQGSLTEENNANYRITFENGTFTIAPARVSLELKLSRAHIRPGRTLKITVTARNQEADLMADGWIQPQTLSLFQGDTTLNLKSQGKGVWEAEYTVPKDAEDPLSFTARCRDLNYRQASDTASVRIGYFGTNPRTGDLILVYGTLLVITALLLIGIGTWYFTKRKK